MKVRSLYITVSKGQISYHRQEVEIH